jgi:hypothetical protein
MSQSNFATTLDVVQKLAYPPENSDVTFRIENGAQSSDNVE